MGFQIRIVAGTDAKNSSATATGEDRHIITDRERKSFGVEDEALRAAVGEYFGKGPKNAYLHSPTPWNDLYKTYGWAQVETLVTVVRAEVIEITSEPVAVRKVTWKNEAQSGTAHYEATLTQQVATETHHNWSKSETVEIGQTISYGVDVPGGSVGGETTFTYAQSWGDEKGWRKEDTIGTEDVVSSELGPRETRTVTLSANKGTMRVRITYRAILTGKTAINYKNKYKKHHFWGLSLSGVMQAGGIPNEIIFTEDITVGFYSDAETVAGEITKLP